jgi:hypothetical protein
MKERQKVTVVLELELSGEIKDLLDVIAGRVYSMTNVEGVTASFLEPQNVETTV